MSFAEKLKFTKSVVNGQNTLVVGYDVTALHWDGYLGKYDNCRLKCGEGKYYVYLWRHAWGEPFYVGCGKSDRWCSKSGRCDDFYLHLDQADAVVYKILDGVDSHTARLFEKYVSVNLVEAGYTLANGDNNTEYMTDEARQRRIDNCKEIDEHELAPSIQEVLGKVLLDKPRVDYRVTDRFIMEYGADYFSRNFIKKRK